MPNWTGAPYKAPLRMRQLPKPEYHAMKAMQRLWHIDDDSECFAAFIRLAYEVSLYGDGMGEQWIMDIITSLRSIPESERRYEL